MAYLQNVIVKRKNLKSRNMHDPDILNSVQTKLKYLNQKQRRFLSCGFKEFLSKIFSEIGQRVQEL